MADPTVWTFFYGSFINLDVLKHVNIVPAAVEVARLHGFDIEVRPLANLLRSDQHTAYGILATVTHDELRLLYTFAQNNLGGTYLPYAVLAETLDGRLRPALCYISHTMDPKEASGDYLDRIVAPARQFGFPDWYIARLEAFRPRASEEAKGAPEG